MIEKIKGAKLVRYEHKHEGCDNRHLFYFDNGFVLEFSHENNEGWIGVERSD